MFYVYILLLGNDAYYVGQTNNLDQRLYRHNAGQVRSTKGFLPVRLMHSESFQTRSESVKREKELKSWKSHEALKRLISVSGGPVV
ncbi:GIY-YIG nuclease family protein [Candidatus Saccharibacteria bacterium]|nr:GIY-YIG nuclease family protein [Candidatus Saccharibacteria bacterium]